MTPTTGPSFTFEEKRTHRRGIFARFSPWLLAAVFFLLLVFLAWGGSKALVTMFGNRREVIKEEMVARATEWPKALEQDILLLPFRVGQVERLVEEHVYGSKAFDFLRTYTLKNVMITSVGVEMGKEQGHDQLIVEARAQDYLTAARQIVLLRSLGSINDFKFSEVSIAELGQVKFNFTLEVVPEFFLAR